MYELHSRCMSCGKKYDYICSSRNCINCMILFKSNYKNVRCRREGCNRCVSNSSYPLCKDCYLEVLALDAEEVRKFRYYNRR